VIVAGDENKQRLGKGVVFVKSQLRRLQQDDLALSERSRQLLNR